MIYLQLYWEFFKAGLFSIGGGMATIPFLQDISDKTGWFTSADLADMIAVAESTPGPIGINTATYVGFKTGMDAYGMAGGVLGAVTTTLGLITPSIIIIIIIAGFLQKFRENRYVSAAFYGLRPASVGLIAAAGLSIVLLSFFQAESIASLMTDFHLNLLPILLGALILVLTRWIPKVRDLHPIVFILISAVLGILLRLE